MEIWIHTVLTRTIYGDGGSAADPHRFTSVAGSKVGPKTGVDFGKEKYFLPFPVIETRFFGHKPRILLVDSLRYFGYKQILINK
jgi:hypothetical protein